MVRQTTVIEQLEEKISILNEDSEKIQSLKTQGIISPWLSKYCDQLIILDILAEEARTYAEIQDPRYKESLLDLKETLDSVAFLCFTKPLKNNFNLYENYRELFLFAQEEYNDEINSVSKILERIRK